MKALLALQFGALLYPFLFGAAATLESQHDALSNQFPSLQPKDAGDIGKGPNILFIMSDDQGKLYT
jgi:hypothetical protein